MIFVRIELFTLLSFVSFRVVRGQRVIIIPRHGSF